MIRSKMKNKKITHQKGKHKVKIETPIIITTLILLVTLCFIPFSSAALTDGIISAWLLDETSGTVAVDEEGLHNGIYTVNNEPADHITGNGVIGYGFKLYNLNKIVVPDDVLYRITNADDWTVSLRLNTTTWNNIVWAAKRDAGGVDWQEYTGGTDARIYGGTEHSLGEMSGFAVNKWHLIVYTYNNGQVNLSVDGINYYSAAATLTADDAAITFGEDHAGNSDVIGGIDEIVIHNRVLTQAEILQLNATYAAGNNIYYTAPPAVNVNITSKDLYNKTRIVWPDIMRQRDDLFMILVNATFQNVSDGSSSCNYSAVNISHQFFSYGENVTLTGSNTFEFTSDHPQENGLYDLLTFDVCRVDTIKRRIEFYINDNATIYRTINKNVIPSCSVGTFQVNNVSTSYITSDNVNVSIRCPLCTASERVRIVKSSIGSRIRLVRSQTAYTDSLDWNVTSMLYEDTEVMHGFESTGTQTINITCNDTDTSISKTVGGILPISLVNEITIDGATSSIVNGTTYEAGENYTFTGGCAGQSISFRQINLTYSNGTYIAGNNTNQLNINNSLLNFGYIFNITMFCRNNGNYSKTVKYVIINDTTNPVINWIDPVEANTSTKTMNESFQFQMTMYDKNLFSYDVEIFDSTAAKRFDYNATNINVSFKAIIESITPDKVGMWTINATVADGHTKKEIKDYKHKIVNPNIIFNFDRIKPNKQIETNNITIMYDGYYDLKSIKTENKKDRYVFEYEYFLLEDKFRLNVMHKYRVYCEDIIYMERSDYTAHFVCPVTMNWVDFESPSVLSYTVERCGNDCFKVDLTTLPDEKIIFSSVGDINIVTETVMFNVTEAAEVFTNSTLRVDRCPDSTEGQLALIIVCVIIMFFIWIGFVFKQNIIGFLSAIALIFVSLTLAACLLVMGYVLLGIGIVLLGVFLFRGDGLST